LAIDRDGIQLRRHRRSGDRIYPGHSLLEANGVVDAAGVRGSGVRQGVHDDGVVDRIPHALYVTNVAARANVLDRDI
jgi:hypothetical protein